MKKIIQKVCLGLFLISNVMAADCPDGAYKLELHFDYEPQKHILCEKSFDGVPLKHGPYRKFDSSGKLVEEKFYKKGKVVLEEPKVLENKEDNSLPQIGILLRALVRGGQPKHASFNTRKCQMNILNWMMFFMLQKPILQVYHFAQSCDIEGSFSPKLDDPFPVNLKLKNFDGYDYVQMQIKMTLDPKKQLKIEALDGTLKGYKTVKFKGTYLLEVRLTSEKLRVKNKGGHVFIYQVDGKAVEVKQEIFVK